MDERNRGRHDRSKLRYPSDLTDEEWAVMEPLIPPAKRGGNKRTVAARGSERADVYPQQPLPVGVVAEGFAAAQHGEWLFLPVEVSVRR